MFGLKQPSFIVGNPLAVIHSQGKGVRVMTKKFMWVCIEVLALTILFVPSPSVCGDYFGKSSDPRAVRIQSGSRFRRNNWVAYMGDLRLSEEEFFYTVGRLDWAAKAREAHNDSRSVYRFGAGLFCAAVILHLYYQQDEVRTWEEYDEKRRQAKGTLTLSLIGPALMLINWMFQAANQAPMEVAVQAADEHNQQLRDE
jgi:hypothetical protein